MTNYGLSGIWTMAVLLGHWSSTPAEGGCFQLGVCCRGRNLTCKSIENGPRRPLHSLRSRDFRLKPRKTVEYRQKPSSAYNHYRLVDRFNDVDHWTATVDDGFSTVSFMAEPVTVTYDGPLNDGRRKSSADFGGSPATSRRSKTDFQRSGADLGGSNADFRGSRANSGGLTLKDDPVVVLDNGAWKKEIRYEIVDGEMAVDGAEVVDRESWNVRNKICYCDQQCRSFLDCCSDYRQACPRSNCKVSQWSKWSACISGRKSFYGVMKRARAVVVEPENGGKRCPPLIEKRACAIQKDGIAQLLPYSLGRARTYGKYSKFVYDMAHRFNEQNDDENYCVIFESSWCNVKCADPGLKSAFKKGAKICVECQRTARQPHRGRCRGDGRPNALSLWTFLRQKTCLGQWTHVNSTKSCSCERNFKKLGRFIFV